jgi:hypothetical protein
MTQYTSHLKQLFDNLRDVGQPVTESSQVLNLVRGLNPKYRYIKPVINAKFPPHTFMSARSYLLLEEQQLEHDTKMEASTALYAGTGRSTDGGSKTHNSSKNKKRNKGNNNSNSPSGASSAPRGGMGGAGGAPQQQPSPACPQSMDRRHGPSLADAYQGHSGVLGPRPPFQTQHAMTAQHLPQLSR